MTSHGKTQSDPVSGQVPPGYLDLRYKDIIAQFPGRAATAANANIKAAGSTPRPPFISPQSPENYPYEHNVYFETPATAGAKVDFILSVGGQAVIIWELSNDSGTTARASSRPSTAPPP